MPVVSSLPWTPHTVTNVTREAHGLFLATLATCAVWRVSREELLTMDQGSAKLITLELRELRANNSCSVAETDEFLDDFVYHPPGECPPTPDGQDAVMEPPIFDIDAAEESHASQMESVLKSNEESASHWWNEEDLFDDSDVSEFEKPLKSRPGDEDRGESYLKDGSSILEFLGMVPTGSDASSAENDAEDISESSSDGEDSDAEDVFKLNAMKPDEWEKPYKSFFLYQRQEATAKVMQMLRSAVASIASGTWSSWGCMETG